MTAIDYNISELCLCGGIQEVLNLSLLRGLIKALWTTYYHSRGMNILNSLNLVWEVFRQMNSYDKKALFLKKCGLERCVKWCVI